MASRRAHDVAPRENLDRLAFLVAFLLGVTGILLLKIPGVHPFLTAGYAALILVLYAVAAWLGGRVKIEPEIIGDNCYYLGFLLTLASLSHTLYQMSDPTVNGGRPVDIPEVISGFGVALSSTILGVFLRVFMMHLRPDFVAKEREVRADINRAFMDFRKGDVRHVVSDEGVCDRVRSNGVGAGRASTEIDGKIYRRPPGIP